MGEPATQRELEETLEWARAHSRFWKVRDDRGLHLRTLLARATETFTAATLLTGQDHGNQAIMLARSLFEDTVVACWIKWVEDPAWVIGRLSAQSRYSALLWDEIIERYPSLRSRIPYSGRTVDEATRDRYRAMFGRNGGATWWAVPAVSEVPEPEPGQSRFKASGERRGLRHLIDEIEKEAEPESDLLEVAGAPSRPSRLLVRRLRYLLDVVNRTNNEVLHYTSYGYAAAYDDAGKAWREDTSEERAPLARSTLLMTFGTMILVMCQHGNRAVEESYLLFRERTEHARP